MCTLYIVSICYVLYVHVAQCSEVTVYTCIYACVYMRVHAHARSVYASACCMDVVQMQHCVHLPMHVTYWKFNAFVWKVFVQIQAEILLR